MWPAGFSFADFAGLEGAKFLAQNDCRMGLSVAAITFNLGYRLADTGCDAI
jgi:hypothetical protein